MTTKKLQLLRGGIPSTAPPKVAGRRVCNTVDPDVKLVWVDYDGPPWVKKVRVVVKTGEKKK